jgi:hypothetical protein
MSNAHFRGYFPSRARAWQLADGQASGSDGGLIPVDIDATIVTAHSEKERAAPTWNKTYGFHQLTAQLPRQERSARTIKPQIRDHERSRASAASQRLSQP